MSLVSALRGKGPSGFGFASTAEEVTAGRDLSGKTVLLTGASSGLGLETLRVLRLRGAHVIAAARTVDKARAAIEKAAAGRGATAVACELSEPASIRGCVAAVRALGRPLAAVVCNAGIMALPKLEQKLGYELQFLTNHIGHFILVDGLLDLLADDGRVVVVASNAHRSAPSVGIELDNLSGERGYQPMRAYGQSKLANILFAAELARRLSGGRTAYAIHPGVIRTELFRHMNPLLRGTLSVVGPLAFKTIPQGAATQCYVATHPDATAFSGQYFVDCNPAEPSPHGRDEELAGRLWAASEKIAAQLSRA
jgi:NAD(P)-dependent dehydrogenase (short-subunit alcohol dehydrogenase family)